MAQEYAPLSVVVVDNSSSDETASVLERYSDRVQIAYNRLNRGFAGGQNQAMAAAPEAQWVLTLNPDVQLTSGFVTAAVRAGEREADTGSVCGKLLAMRPDLSLPDEPVLDSTGIFFTPALRHFDRGNGTVDQGQYDAREYVFGGTGAACLYRRTMIADVSVGGEFFDEDFFAYREDADVAWRAQLLGWNCVYTPESVAYHVRTVVPENRASLPAVINMHSVKNRWLMRMKNMTGDLYRRHWASITARDALVVGGCVLKEQSSLRAFPTVLRMRRKTWAKRRAIMSRRRVNDAAMARWFADLPVSFPCGPREETR